MSRRWIRELVGGWGEEGEGDGKGVDGAEIGVEGEIW